MNKDAFNVSFDAFRRHSDYDFWRYCNENGWPGPNGLVFVDDVAELSQEEYERLVERLRSLKHVDMGQFFPLPKGPDIWKNYFPNKDPTLATFHEGRNDAPEEGKQQQDNSGKHSGTD